MLNFHHIKYLEIDGYDEIVLIEDTLHNKIKRRCIPKYILKNSRCRLNRLRVPKSEIQGVFCLLNVRCHYTKDGKVYK